MTAVRKFRHYIRFPYFILLVVEFFVFAIVMYLGLEINYSNTELVNENRLDEIVLFSLILILSMYVMGLYQSNLREGLAGSLLRISTSFFVGMLLLTLFSYLLSLNFFDSSLLVYLNSSSFLIIIFIRVFFIKFVEYSIKPNIVILGSGYKAQEILKSFQKKSKQDGFNLVGFIHIPGEVDIVDNENLINLNTSLVNFSINNKVDEIVIAVDDLNKTFSMHELLDCRMNGIDVTDVLTFFEREMGKVSVDFLRPGWFVFSDSFHSSAYRDYVKRIFDFLVSLFLLIMISPLMLLIIIAIYVENKFNGSVFISQIRIGEKGKPFSIFKFRSLFTNVGGDGLIEKIPKDEISLTRVGNLIHQFGGDKLPILFNVLRGDMSLVGPRAERPEFVVMLNDSIPYYDERHRVKPGIIGWGQLRHPCGQTENDSKERLQYDLFYVKNQSPMLDFLVMLKTIKASLLRNKNDFRI